MKTIIHLKYGNLSLPCCCYPVPLSRQASRPGHVAHKSKPEKHRCFPLLPSAAPPLHREAGKDMKGMTYQARTGLCATVPWYMGPYWDIKWALDNCCLISVFVNIQRCLKQTIRQYETKIKGTGWE